MEEAAIRQDERQRGAARINELIEVMHSTVGTRAWYAARLSGLMAARSAVLRGEEEEEHDGA